MDIKKSLASLKKSIIKAKHLGTSDIKLGGDLFLRIEAFLYKKGAKPKPAEASPTAQVPAPQQSGDIPPAPTTTPPPTVNPGGGL